jgi:hypothetical protein
MEKSIVRELQQLASDSHASLAELLRKALVVATKLKLVEFKEWIESELDGYIGKTTDQMPAYRQTTAEIKAWNPYNGWIPVHFEDATYGTALSKTGIANPIAEIEEFASKSAKSGYLTQSLPPEIERKLMDDNDGLPLKPVKYIPSARMTGVVAAVRTTVLKWSLKLEEEGILGEGMAFSDEEKRKAAETPAIHIYGNFQGVLGNVSGHNVQIGDYGSVHQQLKDAGVSQSDRNELENILDELKMAKSVKEKKSWAQKGMDWLGKNAGNLSAMTVATIKACLAAHGH